MLGSRRGAKFFGMQSGDLVFAMIWVVEEYMGSGRCEMST